MCMWSHLYDVQSQESKTTLPAGDPRDTPPTQPQVFRITRSWSQSSPSLLDLSPYLPPGLVHKVLADTLWMTEQGTCEILCISDKSPNFSKPQFQREPVITIELILQEVWEDEVRQSMKDAGDPGTWIVSTWMYFPHISLSFPTSSKGWLIATVTGGKRDREACACQAFLCQACFLSSQEKEGGAEWGLWVPESWCSYCAVCSPTKGLCLRARGRPEFSLRLA